MFLNNLSQMTTIILEYIRYMQTVTRDSYG